MAVICPECGGKALKSGYRLVCTSCGFILEEGEMLGEIDIRDKYYYNQQIAHPIGSRVLAVSKGSVVDVKRGLYPLASPEERRQYHIQDEINRLGGLLFAAPGTKKSVLYFYNQLRKDKKTKNYSLDAVLGAIYGVIMNKEMGGKVAPSLLAKEIGAPKRQLRRLYYLYLKLLYPLKTAQNNAFKREIRLYNRKEYGNCYS